MQWLKWKKNIEIVIIIHINWNGFATESVDSVNKIFNMSI